MKDKQIRATTVQWLVVTAMLVIIIIGMFVEFFSTNSESAQMQIEKNFMATTESYATKLRERLIGIQKSGKTIVSVVEKYSKTGLELAEEATEALYVNTDAYMVIMADTNGKGVNQNREWVSLVKTDYFEQIKDGKEQFLYLDNDGITNKEAVLAVIPIYNTQGEEQTVGGMLLMYYPISEFSNFIRGSEFDGNSFYFITDMSGNILESYEGSNVVLNSTTLWELIPDENAKERLKTRMESESNGIINAVDGNVNYRLIYEPVKINDWYMIIGVKTDYAQMLQNQSWDNTKSMFINLVVILCVFFAVIAIMVTINKIRSNEKNRDLADKADTDLLTDLNNKLATERKIKEYIATHPKELGLLFVLDIDNFKKINDTMGHAFGDEVLRTLGHQLRGEFRVSDIIGRAGGDEFMIFLKKIKDETLVEQEANRVAQFFSNFQAGEYVKYSATASIGAAVYPKDAKDFEGLYKAADKALYKAKERGKNQLAFYGDES